MIVPVTAQHHAFAAKLGRMTPQARAQTIQQHMQNPAMVDHIHTILADPTLNATANGGAAGGSAGAGASQVGYTDPSGAFNPNRALDPFSQGQVRRRENIRHQILGWSPLAVTSAGANQKWSATPTCQGGFKATRHVIAPTTIALGITLATLLVGTVNQMVGGTTTPGDVYGPTSYSNRVDWSHCPASIPITANVNSGLAGTAYAGSVGLVDGKSIRPLHTKVQALGLTPTIIPGNSTVTFSYQPFLDFVPRFIALTPGTMFADSLVVQGVQCGQLLQTASQDPYPAALHSDLYAEISLDFDLVNAAVPFQWTVANITPFQAVFQGIAYGDVNPTQLAQGA